MGLFIQSKCTVFIYYFCEKNELPAKQACTYVINIEGLYEHELEIRIQPQANYLVSYGSPACKGNGG